MNKSQLKRKKTKLQKKLHRLRGRKYYNENRDRIQGNRFFGQSVKILNDLFDQKLVTVTPRGIELTYKGKNLFRRLSQLGGRKL